MFDHEGECIRWAQHQVNAGSCAMGAVGSGGLGAFAAGTASFAAVKFWDEVVPGGE